MAWDQRIILIVAAAQRAQGRQMAVDDWEGGENERGFFAAPLSLTGLPPATHFAASAAITPAIRQRIQTRIQNNGLPVGLRFWRIHAGSRALIATNFPASEVRVGQAITWQNILADTTLKAVLDPLDA